MAKDERVQLVTDDDRAHMEQLRQLEFRIEYKEKHADAIKLSVFEDWMRTMDRDQIRQLSEQLVQRGNEMAAAEWQKRTERAQAARERLARKRAEQADAGHPPQPALNQE